MARRRSSSQQHRNWWTREIGGAPNWLTVMTSVFLVAVATLYFAGPNTQPESTWTPVARASETPTPTPTAEPLNVVFIGDSYTGATGASDQQYGWATVVATDLGWNFELLAVGGSGYVNGGNGDSRYIDRVDMAAESSPDLIVVSGGRNDHWFAGDVEVAAADTFAALRDANPDAEIVVLGAWWDDDAPPDDYLAVRAEIESAAASAGVTYIDTGEPLQGKPELMSEDGVHPNDQGHAALAAAVETALASADVAR